MSVGYLDTSAAVKLIVDEPGAAVLARELVTRPDLRLVSSWLLHAELHCALGRHSEDVSADAVRATLETVTLVDLTRGDLLAAGTHAPLRTHDAIHLAVALRVGADAMITYDRELADAARRAGLNVVAP